MADQDKASKTEEPTEKKKASAKQKGEFPRSQELKTLIVLITVALLMVTVREGIGTDLRMVLGTYVEKSAEINVTGPDVVALVQTLGGELMGILMVVFAALVVAAILGTLTQQIPSISFEKLKLDFSKISPLKGLKQKLSLNNFVEFGKTLFKFVVVFGASIIVIWPYRNNIETMMLVPVPDLLDQILELVLYILLTVIALLSLITIVDVIYQRFQHNEKLKMTKQEVKDERKQAEGDPQVRARLRQIRMERARRRMMASVPEADVVITNPTHFAVALKYDHGSMEAPVLVAKGVDLVAARIREVAEEHGVPFVENPPLARTLFATVEIDEEIPPAHYKAVAEVIGYVMKLEKAGLSGKSSSDLRPQGV